MLKKQFTNRKDWRDWLQKNHDKVSEIWLVFYKVKVNKVSMKHEEALEEALCFGWIDSTVRRIDDEKHMQRFTPRKATSIWAASNKERIRKLINEGLMDESGLNAIRTAKANGSWNKLDNIEPRLIIPEELKAAFKGNQRAKDLFDELSPSRQKQLVWWIVTAKRDETKGKRIKQMITLLLKEDEE